MSQKLNSPLGFFGTTQHRKRCTWGTVSPSPCHLRTTGLSCTRTTRRRLSRTFDLPNTFSGRYSAYKLSPETLYWTSDAWNLRLFSIFQDWTPSDIIKYTMAECLYSAPQTPLSMVTTPCHAQYFWRTDLSCNCSAAPAFMETVLRELDQQTGWGR